MRAEVRATIGRTLRVVGILAMAVTRKLPFITIVTDDPARRRAMRRATTRAISRDDMNRQVHASLSRRVREVREDLYGLHGAQFLADALELPLRTWVNYERGVTIPAGVILRLVVATGVNSRWLLDGRGPKYPARDSRDA